MSKIPQAAVNWGWRQKDWDREFQAWWRRGVVPAEAAKMRRGMAESVPGARAIHLAIAEEWDRIAEGKY